MAGAAFAANLFNEEAEFFARYRLDQLSDHIIYTNTRFTRELIEFMLTFLRPILERPTHRKGAIDADTQLLVALSYFASGGFQWAAGKQFSGM